MEHIDSTIDTGLWNLAVIYAILLVLYK